MTHLVHSTNTGLKHTFLPFLDTENAGSPGYMMLMMMYGEVMMMSLVYFAKQRTDCSGQGHASSGQLGTTGHYPYSQLL